jgi:hypothetical protein
MKKVVGLVAAIALFFGACATQPKVDWQGRVGNYTYDQAVLELGPPDKNAQLTDGARVAEWLTARSRQGATWVGHPRGGWMQTVDSPSPDYYLRLTFDANGKLQSWKKYAK